MRCWIAGRTATLAGSRAAGAAVCGAATATAGWLFMVWSDLDSDSHFFATSFNPAQPLTTASGLNTSSPATPLTWLADAVKSLQGHGTTVNAGIGQVQYAPQSRRIPIPGCPGDGSSSGRATGCFNAIYSNNDTLATSSPLNAAPYGQVVDGSSLVMSTQLNPRGPGPRGYVLTIRSPAIRPRPGTRT
jgi:hypothetical protein